MSAFRSLFIKINPPSLFSSRTIVTNCLRCHVFNTSLIMYNQRRNYAKRGIVKERKGNGPKYEMHDAELSKLIPVEEFEALTTGVFEKLKTEYSAQLSLRTGYGIETLSVELDGSVHPLKDVAQISRKSSNLVVLNLGALPDAIKPVLNALNKSGMNLAPQIDGHKIFLNLPKITLEHREILDKNAKTLFNSAKQELTELQNSFIDTAKLQKTGVGKDTIRDAIENIRYRTQQMIRKCEELYHSRQNSTHKKLIKQ